MNKKLLSLLFVAVAATSSVNAMDKPQTVERQNEETQKNDCFKKSKDFFKDNPYNVTAIAAGVFAVGSLAFTGYKLFSNKKTFAIAKKLLTSPKKIGENLKAIWKQDKLVCLGVIGSLASIGYLIVFGGVKANNKFKLITKENVNPFNWTCWNNTSCGCGEKNENSEEEINENTKLIIPSKLLKS